MTNFEKMMESVNLAENFRKQWVEMRTYMSCGTCPARQTFKCNANEVSMAECEENLNAWLDEEVPEDE